MSHPRGPEQWRWDPHQPSGVVAGGGHEMTNAEYDAWYEKWSDPDSSYWRRDRIAQRARRNERRREERQARER